MSFDFYLATLYGLICAGSSIILMYVKKGILPGWATLLTSLLGMLLWSLAVKRTQLTLIELSSIFDAVGALAYFLGFVLCGEKVNQFQILGICLLVFSIYLINK
jgi:drug/metabolite transporter (DMT)-like permease